MQLRYYQEEAIQSIFDYFENDDGNPVICLPTGTGKSVVIGGFTQRIFHYWPAQRILMLTHNKELIAQNAAKLIGMWPSAPVGIFSADLGQKQPALPIVFGGIGSVSKCPEIFGHRDLVIVDECHLISASENTMYQKTLAVLKEINPYLKVIGLTATPFRLKQGMITEGGIFTDFCYDVSGIEPFNRLIDEGFLAPLVPRPTETTFDISGVHIRMGEYVQSELEAATDDEKTRFAAIQETVAYGADRHSWLMFENSIAHVEQSAAMLNSLGIAAAAVHSKLGKEENDKRIAAFKSGELRCIVNKDMLTTGFDHPAIDLIASLRHTCSPGLHVQMLGRGTRPSIETGKQNCLVLDFARNAERLGPINDPVIPRAPGKGRASGEMPVKICPQCGMYNHAPARFCGGRAKEDERYNPASGCGHEFIFEVKFEETSSTKELIKKIDDAKPVVDLVNVSSVFYNLHSKTGQPDSIKVSYLCGVQTFNEWVCLEHPGFAGKKARDWWRMRHDDSPPESTAEALERVSQLRTPKQIKVWLNKKPHPEIMGYYG